MGTVLFSVANTAAAATSLRALFGGLVLMLILLPLQLVLGHNKQAVKAIFFIIFSTIIICSSAIFAASLAHTNSAVVLPSPTERKLWQY